MDNLWLASALWIGLALAASVISIRKATEIDPAMVFRV